MKILGVLETYPKILIAVGELLYVLEGVRLIEYNFPSTQTRWQIFRREDMWAFDITAPKQPERRLRPSVLYNALQSYPKENQFISLCRKIVLR